MDLTIETSRLRLRPPRVDDFDRYLLLWNQPEPPDTASPIELSPEDAWARLLRFVGHWTHFGYGLFLVEDRSSKEIIGEMGIAHFRRGMGRHFDGVPEAAWRVLVARRGQGIAVEAMARVLAWFDDIEISERTVCLIQDTNVRSLRVADRLGYRRFDVGHYRHAPAILLERLRP